jgi:hypothetical protein
VTGGKGRTPRYLVMLCSGGGQFMPQSGYESCSRTS